MIKYFKELVLKPIAVFFAGGYEQVREINKKYANPSLKTSKAVRISLVLLRIYLIFLIGILFFKFYTMVAK